MIDLKVLGPPGVTAGEREVPRELLWKKHLALFVYLTLSERGCSREHLIGLLWPDKPDRKARHSLNEALRAVRNLLGDSLISEGDMVRIQPGTVRTDLDSHDPLELEGEFLEGLVVSGASEFEEWVSQRRRELEREAVRALIVSASGALDAGRLEGAVESVHRALAIDPTAEPAAVLLMKAQALMGDRTAALRTFEELSAALSETLNTQPSAAAVLVRDNIERGLFEGRREGGDGDERERPPGPFLVGPGSRLLERLVANWEAARAGESRQVVVMGDAGTGKTRLLREIRARASLDGAVISQLRCVAGEDAGLEWRALTAGLVSPAVTAVPPQAVAGLIPHAPELAVLCPGASGHEPLETAAAFTEAVAAISRDLPVLITVDDAGFGAASVLRDLMTMTGRLDDSPVLLVVAVGRVEQGGEGGGRAIVIDRAVEQIRRSAEGEILECRNLDEASLVDLVRGAFPSRESNEIGRLARRIFRDTLGNPFLAVELIEAVRTGLELSDTAGWPAAGRTLDATRPGELPHNVAAAIRWRFRLLSEEAQDVLRVIAVTGPQREAFIARVLPSGDAETEAALDELEREGWIVMDPGGYSVQARLVAEVIISELMTRGRRRRIEERARAVDSEP